MENYSKLTDRIIRYFDEQNYQAVIELLPDSLLVKSKNEIYYLGKGNAYSGLHDYENAITHYLEAVHINPLYGDAYNKLGLLYLHTQNHQLSIRNFEKTIEVSPKKIWGYYNLGIVYQKLGQYETSIEYFDKVISMDIKCDAAFYNRGLAYFRSGRYAKALPDFLRKLKLTNATPDYFTSDATDRIAEIEILLQYPPLSVCVQIVDQIKNLLQSNQSHLIHYTSMSIGKALILENTPLRLHEGTFVSSGHENNELSTFLSLNRFDIAQQDPNRMKLFNQKGLPFIGCFVPLNKEHDLNLWKICSKQENNEPKGCALTLQTAKLVDSLATKLEIKQDSYLASTQPEDFNFYRVAYLSDDHTTPGFMIPDAGNEVNKKLNGLLLKLKSSIEMFYSEHKAGTFASHFLKDKLNYIHFLFKCAKCAYEQEIRMIMSGKGFEPVVDLSCIPPRVYIDLLPLQGLVTRIAIGPHVEHATELASAMSYRLKSQNQFKPASIFISEAVV